MKDYSNIHSRIQAQILKEDKKKENVRKSKLKENVKAQATIKNINKERKRRAIIKGAVSKKEVTPYKASSFRANQLKAKAKKMRKELESGDLDNRTTFFGIQNFDSALRTKVKIVAAENDIGLKSLVIQLFEKAWEEHEAKKKK